MVGKPCGWGAGICSLETKYICREKGPLEFSIKADRVGQSAQMSWEVKWTPSWENTPGQDGIIFICIGSPYEITSAVPGSHFPTKNPTLPRTSHNSWLPGTRKLKGVLGPSVVADIKRLCFHRLCCIPKILRQKTTTNLSCSEFLWGFRYSGDGSSLLHDVWGFQGGFCTHRSGAWAVMAKGLARTPIHGLSMWVGLFTTWQLS